MDALDLDTLTVKQLLQLQVRLLASIEAALAVEVADSNECQHPEARRVSLSTPSDLNHWVCLDCKYDSKADVMQ
jgi:hypothetical protein